MFSAEPAGYDDHRRSLAAGSRQRNASTANALCDALLALIPGELTWMINAAGLRGGYAVTDTEVRHAMRWAFESLKIAMEPGGAVALAALCAGYHPAKGRTVAAVLSGAMSMPPPSPHAWRDRRGPIRKKVLYSIILD